MVTLKLVDAGRRELEAMLLSLTAGRGAAPIDFTTPLGDPGWFGPESVTWKVHADLGTMLAGGVSALLLQTLHPLAMAGVYDHSAFREDPLGRLRRTATFVSGTTFGSSAVAEDLVAKVRRVHERVVGTAPDGRPYAAADPALLTWVHTAEMVSFLRSFRRYAQPLTLAEQDQYFRETAIVAERLGAANVPKSVAEVRSYFASLRGELSYGAQAQETVERLLASPLPFAGSRFAASPFFEAAIDLLPRWARRMMGFRELPVVERAAIRPGFFAVATAMRWIVRETAATKARRRVAADCHPERSPATTTLASTTPSPNESAA